VLTAGWYTPAHTTVRCARWRAGGRRLC